MATELFGWERLRHGGLLLDATRLRTVAAHDPGPLPGYHAEVMRRLLAGLSEAASADTNAFITFVLEVVCGFGPGVGSWQRGSQIGTQWTRRAVTGESVRPRQLWTGEHGALLPVFIDDSDRLGVGSGRRSTSQVLQWLRAGPERLAVLTNGSQWRLIFAGLDFDAWCEWDTDLWLEEGAIGAQVAALRVLLAPAQFTPSGPVAMPRLLQAVLDSRKGQAELSAALGERVREAVEQLVQSHSVVLASECSEVDPADIYRAAVRVVMRMVVVLFAESRELLPRDNALYHGTYGLGGLLGELERTAARGGNRLRRQYTAWPRVLALFQLVAAGSHHPALPVPAYGGDLFEPAAVNPGAGLERALRVFECACFDNEVLSDHDALIILERLTRTRVKVRQGRSATWIQAPVDFSDLSSEYIGILYEGLLDFELRTAPAGDPVIFLSVGNQPALPLSRLEEMGDGAIKELLAKMKDTSSSSDVSEGEEEAAPEEAAEPDDGNDDSGDADAETEEDVAPEAEDARHATRSRAEQWARRAVMAGGLVRRARGTRAEHEAAVSRKARQLVTRVVLPNERYLVRWGGTRKGSGSFYTRPGLAVPLVQRTLRPLAWNPPVDANGAPAPDAPAAAWTPKLPEQILDITVCDPACGSGTFPIGALRYLTDALFASLHFHGRITATGNEALVRLLSGGSAAAGVERLSEERLPCRPDDATFEPRLKAILRRHVVERCIYGVDLDPLAVELCRLALWIETMDRTLPFSFIDHKIKCGNGLIGAWFDQFQHYPVMAWKNREGGDKGHSYGVHFEQDARGKALKSWTKDVLTLDLQRFLSGRTLFDADQLVAASAVHDAALQTLASLHDLPVQEAAERGRRYRALLLGSPAWQKLKAAMDLWCACWFWPADELAAAPLPSTLATPSNETLKVAAGIAERKRFFHWELEFPDVFRAAGSGFSAILGNPPWNTEKPNSKEFFSDLDPLFRTYGKQEALTVQKALFADAAVERRWLDYSADFRSQSNFVGHAANPSGDPTVATANDERFTISRGRENAAVHERWRAARRKSVGFADAAHVYRHQGSADVNLYKLFIEQAHALLHPKGRLGFIVPSGVYSDNGTAALRELFLDKCQWEWLFGFENREKIFDIDSRQKFNPIIVQKGGRTEAIRTAFMRRTFAEWEDAELIATPYTRAQVERFSPKSRSILEVESARDLEILEKIYANSVLLGDDGPNGWGVKYSTEFHMTNDSKLFPPRAKWEAQGYRPDEYSRWLKGNWRPIAALWPELGIDPSMVVPTEVELEEWLFDSSAGPEERVARAQFVHGHLLKPGDVQRTEWRLRCAQPPYDALPVPRVAIPAGIILSREADAWVREGEIEDVALPLYEGRMIGQFDFSQKGWVSGKGRTAVWRDIAWEEKQVEPQYLVAARDAASSQKVDLGSKIAYMRISSSTNARTTIATYLQGAPAGDSVFFFIPNLRPVRTSLVVSALLSTYAFDSVARVRLSGLNMSEFLMLETPLPRRDEPFEKALAQLMLATACPNQTFAAQWLDVVADDADLRPWKSLWSLASGNRAWQIAKINALAAHWYGLEPADIRSILSNCDLPSGDPTATTRVKGFWRIDRSLPPALRGTILFAIAAHQAGALSEGITSMVDRLQTAPESICLSDIGYGLKISKSSSDSVASLLGPRYFDWQLSQTREESRAECHLHARNRLGDLSYQALVRANRDEEGETETSTVRTQRQTDAVRESPAQPSLFG